MWALTAVHLRVGVSSRGGGFGRLLGGDKGARNESFGNDYKYVNGAWRMHMYRILHCDMVVCHIIPNRADDF